MNLDLTGQSVHSITLDYAVSLLLDGGVDIRIESAFSLRNPSGHVAAIDPGELGPGLDYIVVVLHHTITGAVARDNGTLMLDFDNGARIDVAPDEAYEAWTLAGPRGLEGRRSTGR